MSFNLNEGDDDHEFEDVDDAYFSASDGLSSSDRSSEDEHQHRARPSGAGSAAAVAHHVRDTHNVDDIVPTAVVIFRGCESVESRSGAVSTPPVKSDRCDRRGNRGVIPAANTRSACSQPARGMTPSSRAAENHPCKKTSLPQDLDRDASKVFKDRPELHGVGKVRGANGIDVAGARRADGERGSAIFAGISVSDLKFDEFEKVDDRAGYAVVRVSDQHGNRWETVPRRLLRRDGSKIRCAIWCEEIQVPINPGVEGVLFELLVAIQPSDDNGRRQQSNSDSGIKELDTTDTSEHIAEEGHENVGSSKYEAYGRQETAAHGCKLQSEGRDSSENYRRLGAVALLLAEVADMWRITESQLFDDAGGVRGTIKLGARFLRRSRRIVTATCARKIPAILRTPRDTTEVSRVTERNQGPATAVPRLRHAGRLTRNGETPTSRNYASRLPDEDGSPGRAAKKDAIGRINMSGGALTLKNETFCRRKDQGRAPRAKILYRGLCLPFRWFRSSSEAAVRKSLRGALGINDTSIRSPRLHDVASGGRVYLNNSTPSELTLLAIIDDVTPISPQSNSMLLNHGCVAGQTPTTCLTSSPGSVRKQCDDDDRAPIDNMSTQAMPPTQTELCRSRSFESKACEQSNDIKPHSTSVPTKEGQSLPEIEQATGSNSRCASRAGPEISANEHEQKWRRRTQREREVDQERERVMHRERRRKVACRSVCRILRHAIGKATREALWRWRVRTVKQIIEQERADDDERKSRKSVEVLECLRRKISSLTAASQEGLLAVSIDALENDLHASEGNESPDSAHLGFSHWNDSDKRSDMTGRKNGGSIERAVATLEADVTRLYATTLEESRCFQARLSETYGIQGVSALSYGSRKTPAAAAMEIAINTPPLTPQSPPEVRQSTTDRTDVVGSYHYDDKDGWVSWRGRPKTADSGEMREDGNLGLRPMVECEGHDGGGARSESAMLEAFMSEHAFPVRAGTECFAPLDVSLRRLEDELKGILAAPMQRRRTSRDRHFGDANSNKFDLQLVLWALYRVFSSLPPCLCSPTFESAWVDHVSPARPDRRDCRRGHNSTTAHANGDMDGSRGVDLSAFLELCRGADFILSVGNGSNGSTGNGLNCGVRRRNNKNERPWGTRHVEEGQQLQPDFSISVVADVIAGLTAGTRAGETAFHPLHPSVAIDVFEGAARYASPCRGRTTTASSGVYTWFHQHHSKCDPGGHCYRRGARHGTPANRHCRGRRRTRYAHGRLKYEPFCTAVLRVIDLLIANSTSGVTGSSTNTHAPATDVALPACPRAIHDYNFEARAPPPASPNSGSHGANRDVVLRSARIQLVRLAKDLALQQLFYDDSHTRETLATMDPFVRTALNVNGHILSEIFRHYCRTHSPLQACTVKPRNDAGGTSGRTSGYGCSGATPKMCFEGGKAFARDFSVVPLAASVQELAELWKAACRQQQQEKGGERGHEMEAKNGNCTGAGDEGAVLSSRILTFSGFQNLLARCACRHSYRTFGLKSALKSAPPCSSATHHHREDVLQDDCRRVHAIDGRKTDSFELRRCLLHHPGPVILAFLEAMHVSDGCRSILRIDDGRGGLRRSVLERGFCRP